MVRYSPRLTSKLSSRLPPLGLTLHVGLAEVITFEQQDLVAGDRQRVGEAVAIVEASGMTALAETAPGAARRIGLIEIDWHDLDLRALQPQIELATAGVAQACLHDHRRFEPRAGRHQSDIVIGDATFQKISAWLIEQDRGDGRAVDHHQSGSTCSY